MVSNRPPRRGELVRGGKAGLIQLVLGQGGWRIEKAIVLFSFFLSLRPIGRRELIRDAANETRFLIAAHLMPHHLKWNAFRHEATSVAHGQHFGPGLGWCVAHGPTGFQAGIERLLDCRFGCLPTRRAIVADASAITRRRIEDAEGQNERENGSHGFASKVHTLPAIKDTRGRPCGQLGQQI